MRERSYRQLGNWLQNKWRNAGVRLAEATSVLQPLLDDASKNITEAILSAEIQAERDAETTPLRSQTQRRTQTTIDKVAALHARTKNLKIQIRRLNKSIETAGSQLEEPDELMPPSSVLQLTIELEEKEEELWKANETLERHRISLGSGYAAVDRLLRSEWTRLRILLLAKKQILRAKLRERKNHYRQADRTSHLATNAANHHSTPSRMSFSMSPCMSFTIQIR